MENNLVDRLLASGQTINHLNKVLNKKTRKINRLRETIKDLAAQVKSLSPKAEEGVLVGCDFGRKASPVDCG